MQFSTNPSVSCVILLSIQDDISHHSSLLKKISTYNTQINVTCSYTIKRMTGMQANFAIFSTCCLYITVLECLNQTREGFGPYRHYIINILNKCGVSVVAARLITISPYVTIDYKECKLFTVQISCAN